MDVRETALDELTKIVGERNISTDPVDLIPYTRDSYSPLIGQDVPLPGFVVLPDGTEEVQKVLLVANKYKIPVYPRSFGVNLAGSALPYKEGIVIDLKRMNRIHEIDESTMTATIEPGVTWGALRKTARKKGMDAIVIGGPYCVGPVGNFLLTNITHYSTIYSPDRAVTLEVVLPNGELLRTGSQATKIGAELNPYFRYAYGPDITGLFRGSMGNFGIITKMVIRLRPLGEIEETVLYGFDDLEAALSAMQSIERLEITRCNCIYNNHYLVHEPLTPEEQKDAKLRESIRAGLPDYIMAPGIKGNRKLVKVYREMIEKEVSRRGGAEARLPENISKPIIALAEGASDMSLRMYAPFSGYACAVGCLPVAGVTKISEAVIEMVKRYEIKDPVSGAIQMPEMVVIPYDRCSTVYVEQELLYNPVEKDEVKKVFSCIREIYRMMVLKYGGVHTMLNKSLMERAMMPTYRNLIRSIKGIVDPKDILQPGGPYSFGK